MVADRGGSEAKCPGGTDRGAKQLFLTTPYLLPFPGDYVASWSFRRTPAQLVLTLLFGAIVATRRNPRSRRPPGHSAPSSLHGTLLATRHPFSLLLSSGQRPPEHRYSPDDYVFS